MSVAKQVFFLFSFSPFSFSFYLFLLAPFLIRFAVEASS